MGALTVMASSASLYVKNNFAVVPWWMWALQIVVTTFFSMFLFVILSEFISNPEVTVRYVVLGNVVQSIAMTTLYSVSEIPGLEKHIGTLPSIMSTPANLFVVFLGMSLFNILTGMVSAVLSLGYAVFVFGVDLSAANMVSVIAVISLTALSLSGFGMIIGSIGLRLRTSIIVANLVSYIGLLICGVNFPLSYLPEAVQWIARAFPLTYGVEAMRGAADGLAVGDLAGSLMAMALLGAVYLALSAVLFRLFEKKARKTGSFDTF